MNREVLIAYGDNQVRRRPVEEKYDYSWVPRYFEWLDGDDKAPESTAEEAIFRNLRAKGWGL